MVPWPSWGRKETRPSSCPTWSALPCGSEHPGHTAAPALRHTEYAIKIPLFATLMIKIKVRTHLRGQLPYYYILNCSNVIPYWTSWRQFSRWHGLMIFTESCFESVLDSDPDADPQIWRCWSKSSSSLKWLKWNNKPINSLLRFRYGFYFTKVWKLKFFIFVIWKFGTPNIPYKTVT